MKRQLKKLAFVIMATGIVFSSCKKDKAEENEEEVITTLRVTAVPAGGGAALVFEFDDPDGPGGAAPAQDDIELAASTTYNVTLELLNKTETPEGDITAEITEESDAHRFYFEPSASSNITVSNLNTDGDGLPLGLTSTWTTGATATGTIKITLRHYPGNPPGKAADDAVTSSKSGTDIAVDFITVVN